MCSSAVHSIISTDGRWTRSSAARSTANRSGCNGSWNGFDALNFSAVQVGYVFGGKAAGKLYMRNLALYLTGSNLFYCSGVDMQRGTVYPYTRTVTLSLRATF